MPKKVLLVILDGVADGAQEGRKTALQLAQKPVLDSFSKSGVGGVLDNQSEESPGLGPDSGVSTWLLLGYDRSDYPGRGYLDALGAGVNVKPTDVCIRANFAAVREGDSPLQDVPLNMKSVQHKHFIVTDRRAGRDIEGLHDLAKGIANINIEGVPVRFFRSLGHRGVIVLSSTAVSPNVTGSDPGADNLAVREIKATASDNASEKTAATLNKWSAGVYEALKNDPANKYRKVPANYVLLRDPGMWRSVKSFKEKHGFTGMVVAASPVVKGIGRMLEMDIKDVVGASGDMKSNLRDKTMAAIDGLTKYDFVILHILGTDAVSHDRKMDAKTGFIDKIDREVFGRIREYVDKKKVLIAVTSDHICSVYTGKHEKGAFPFCLYTQGMKPNQTAAFDEVSSKEPLGPKLDIEDFMEFLNHHRA
jgi:2,3-bisphosphoglycerate-independent phosphoglycerate mutase